MPKLVYSNERFGSGATIELKSGEKCMISTAQAGVLIRSYQKGFFGSLFGVIFRSDALQRKKVCRAAKTAASLAAAYPDQTRAFKFRNPVLQAFANAVWHCSSASEVAYVCNESSLVELGLKAKSK